MARREAQAMAKPVGKWIWNTRQNGKVEGRNITDSNQVIRNVFHDCFRSSVPIKRP
jgi:hypothetical protein